jgi:hypothetical protein
MASCLDAYSLFDDEILNLLDDRIEDLLHLISVSGLASPVAGLTT